METRKQYFGSQMLNSGRAAAALSLTAIFMVFSVAFLVPEPSLGLERSERRHPSLEMMMDRLGSLLQLSPEQQSAMEPIIAEEMQRKRETLDQYRAENRKSRSELRLDLIEIEENTSEQLAEVLSPEQLVKFNRFREKRRISLAVRHAGRDDGSMRDDLDESVPRPENQSDAQMPPARQP